MMQMMAAEAESLLREVEALRKERDSLLRRVEEANKLLAEAMPRYEASGTFRPADWYERRSALARQEPGT